MSWNDVPVEIIASMLLQSNRDGLRGVLYVGLLVERRVLEYINAVYGSIHAFFNSGLDIEKYSPVHHRCTSGWRHLRGKGETTETYSRKYRNQYHGDTIVRYTPHMNTYSPERGSVLCARYNRGYAVGLSISSWYNVTRDDKQVRVIIEDIETYCQVMVSHHFNTDDTTHTAISIQEYGGDVITREITASPEFVEKILSPDLSDYSYWSRIYRKNFEILNALLSLDIEKRDLISKLNI